jgi:hypothetical protein
MKETRNKKRKRKKGIWLTGPSLAQQRSARSGPALRASLLFFYLSLFVFLTHLYSNMNISSYTTHFLDPFVFTRSELETLTPRPTYPSIYSPHLRRSKLLSLKS